MLMALQWQLEQSQWWSADALLQLQLRQLELLLRQTAESIPYYRDQFQAASIDLSVPLTLESWHKVPVLPRDTLQNRGNELLNTWLGAEHGETFEKTTSGSTGQSMTITGTDADNLFWLALTMRDHHWHRRTFSGRFVSIRSGRYIENPLEVLHADVWGAPPSYVYNTGPSTIFYHTMPIANQADLLIELQPEYLLAYPSNVMMLTHHFQRNNLKLSSLRGIITYGELLLPEVHENCREVWGAPVTDMYSCEEVGYIALQCPDHQHYHCQSESVLVEVLNDAGEPCRPGEIGRVVLTSLHNFAMPLIRYVNRDYAEVGHPCPCGRGLPTIRRLLGRERNMAIGLDGSRFWPEVNRRIWTSVQEVEEVQLVQTELDHIEIRAVSQQPLGPNQQRQLESAIRDSLGQAYHFTYQHRHEILRHANGKYERFIGLPLTK
jgi:phenylacetate-CoA ligase